MSTSASQSSPQNGAPAHDTALGLARLVVRAHTGTTPDEVARDLLSALLVAVGAPAGALAIDEPSSTKAEPEVRLLAAIGDTSALAVLLRAGAGDAAGHSVGAYPAYVRIPLPLEASGAAHNAASSSATRGALVVLAWDTAQTHETRLHATSYIAVLREPISAAILSVLAAERRGEQERMAEARAAALAEAHAARADWEQTFDAVTDPIAVISANYKVERVNAAYRRLFGIGPDEPVARPCFAVHNGGHSTCTGCPLPDTVESGAPGYVEQEVLVRTGPKNVLERRLFHIWTYPVYDAAGQVRRVVEIMRDVTEHERLRQLTTQAEALQAADHLKAELLGTVSHELRSPLAAIKGYASTLLRHERRLPRAERHEFLVAIGEASSRLEVIINRLLEMSQLETGDAIINRFPMDIVPLTHEAVAEARAQAPGDGQPEVAFSVTTLDADGLVAERVPLIYADPRAIRDVVDNLLQNAIKYSPQGGQIDVVLRPVRAGASQVVPDRGPTPSRPRPRLPQESGSDEDFLELTVSDHGVGIPVEHLGRIFDRFHRVDTRLTREVDGLGLGLAICRRIVELHGGAIWAESQPGDGSSFHVLLPIAVQPAQQEDPKE